MSELRGLVHLLIFWLLYGLKTDSLPHSFQHVFSAARNYENLQGLGLLKGTGDQGLSSVRGVGEDLSSRPAQLQCPVVLSS